MSKRRALVIGRHRPGRPIEADVHVTARALDDAGWLVGARVVKHKKELRHRARRAVHREVELVVVVGGDGAVMQVATELVGSGIPLGVVPDGTGNLFAGNLGLPTDRSDAITTILDGQERRIDVGRIRIDGKQRAFTIACGIGYDARVMDETSHERKVRWGQLAYLSAALSQAASVDAVPHHLEIDGEEIDLEAAQVFIANAGRMLPLVEPRLPVDPEDGLLDVIAITASGPLPAVLAGWEALRQDELGESGGGHAFRARARDVRVRTDGRRRVEIDGSVAGSTPVHVRVVPRGLTVLVPAR